MIKENKNTIIRWIADQVKIRDLIWIIAIFWLFAQKTGAVMDNIIFTKSFAQEVSQKLDCKLEKEEFINYKKDQKEEYEKIINKIDRINDKIDRILLRGSSGV